MTEQITSPVGQIVYMGLDKARTNFSGREEYSMRLMFDGNTAEGKAFKEQVAEVNANKVVTQSKTYDIPAGHYIVSAWSKYKPTVLDSDGTAVEEIPYFSRGSTGQAIMTVKVFKGEKGGGLNLSGAVILDLELAASEQKENPTLNNLRDAINKVKKG